MTTITTRFGNAGQGLGTAAGSPTLADTLRDMADDLTELRTQFIALLAKLDTDLSLEEMIELVNDVKAKYNAHRVLTGGGEHTNADSTNAVSSADATDLATGITLANEIKADLNAHLADSELDEAITLLNELKVDYEAHRILTAGGVHGAADSTNAITAADATDLATAYTLANDLKAMYEAHRVLIGGGEHTNYDSIDVITEADATTFATLKALANDLRTQYEAHRVHEAANATGPFAGCAFTDQGGDVCRLTDSSNPFGSDDIGKQIVIANATSGGNDGTFTITDAAAGWVEYTNASLVAEAFAAPTTGTIAAVHGAPDATNTVAAVAVGTAGIHQQDDATNVVSSADATTQATLNTLVNEIRTDYEAHRQNTTSHGAADATNVISEPAAATDFESTLTPAALTTIKG